MQVEIKIDESLKSPRLVIYTKEMTDEINALVERLSGPQSQSLLGFQGDEMQLLSPKEIIRIYSQQQKVIAETESGLFTLRLRLYELEDRLSLSHFVRISQSELVNFNHVRKLDLSYNGTIGIVFKNGGQSYVSRRYMPKIKEYLGI